MKTNKVSPWEGKLVWVDNPRSGMSKKGTEWKSVDFTLKYKDEQNNDRHITFNTFGLDRVEKILSAPSGSMIRVAWKPESREYNGKWWQKLDAYDITVLGENKDAEAQASDNAETAEDGDLPW